MQVTARNLETARIVISSDQEMIRSALRGLLESQGVAVVAECANRPEALSATLLAKPHLILLDFDLCTRCTGVSERIGALLHAACGTPVLILTARDDCQAALAALEHGAVGFVMKSRSPETLHRAIRAGIAGETWLERSTMAAVFRSASPSAPGGGNGNGNHNSSASDHGSEPQLTRREREIVELVLLGMQNKAIAERLFISSTTVRHHLTTIFDKLEVSNRLELMRKLFDGTSFLQPDVLAAH